jgi:hypothetical protein
LQKSFSIIDVISSLFLNVVLKIFITRGGIMMNHTLKLAILIVGAFVITTQATPTIELDSANSTPSATDVSDLNWIGTYTADELEITVFRNAATFTFTDFHIYISNWDLLINEPDVFSEYFDKSVVAAGGATQSHHWYVDYYEGEIPPGDYFQADVSGFPAGTTFKLRATPAPGVFVLVGIGAGLVGWMRRSKAI